MEKNFVKCSDCWRYGVRATEQYNGFTWTYNYPKCKEILTKQGYLGCTKGVTTSMVIEAITEEITLEKERLRVKAASLETLEDATDKLIAKCDSLERHKKWLELQQKEKGCRAYIDWIDAMRLTSYYAGRMTNNTPRSMRPFCKNSHMSTVVNDPKHLSTFLCENCGEAVQVTTALLSKELRFKCPVCHQENHYDLS
jgi:hypothetical protein